MIYGIKYHHFLLAKEIRVYYEHGTDLSHVTDICETMTLSPIMFTSIALLEKNDQGDTIIRHQYN
jgi:hypothetical protein